MRTASAGRVVEPIAWKMPRKTNSTSPSGVTTVRTRSFLKLKL